MAPPSVLLSCEAIGKRYGARPLFENLSFSLREGDRVGLVGPNGSGKSTLLRILAGLEVPDSGIRTVRRGLRLAYVAQDPVFAADLSVEDTALASLDGSVLEEFERHVRVGMVLGRLGFGDFSQLAGTLSGGWQKRLAFACALVGEPDVLLMDEPTNHLDLEGILELEELLRTEARAFLVVSHDRTFLERTARRMLELDRVYPEGLLEVDGTYSDLLEKRDEVRRNQADYEATLANRARRELEWLRRGPKARTTKAKARIDEAHRIMGELDTVRERTSGGVAGLDFAESGRKTKRLLFAHGLEKSFDGRPVLAGVDLLLRPGTRLGVLGPNGSGKTTLLSILAGELEPDSGELERAQFLKIVRFEQRRESLDRTATLRRALAPEGDTLIQPDGRPVHVAGWAARFLFRGEQLETPVSRLSGGEQARILLARLMLQPADVLILDEPTNDLDIPTLEVLEESLLEFGERGGALVLVTHDRFLLDRVCTAILALDEGRGHHVADVAQWEEEQRRAAAPVKPAKPAPQPAQKPAPQPAKKPMPQSAQKPTLQPAPQPAPSKGEARVEVRKVEATPTPRPAARRKLSFNEQREWDGMEAAILAAEQALERAQSAVDDPAVAADAAELHTRCVALEAAQAEVDRLYARWSELEAKRG